MTEQRDLPAGYFSEWLRNIRSALAHDTEIDVPCGECTACCRSSYFIHIKPDEKRTIFSIPRALLFPAPGLPKGNFVLGYNENGSCPMLVNDKCSIYADRPVTCRTYDCRIFSAAGMEASEKEKAAINQQVRRWKFEYSGKDDRDRHAAVKASAKFLREHADSFPEGVIPANSTQLAILAIKVYDVFLGEKQYSIMELIHAAVEAKAKFDGND